MNLIMNACDAMTGNDKAHRTLRVTTRAQGDDEVSVSVTDQGGAIPDGCLEKIFEPFYTTKEPGRGTGLGLAIVARSVHEMGGVVWVDGAREGGAAFKLFFPIARPR